MTLLLPLLLLLADAPKPGEERAVAFLITEVPKWSKENKCFSCHNNGDSARALFAARRQGVKPPDKTLDDTLAFLAQPEKWDKNGPDGPFNDRKLARIQFAAALVEAAEAGLIKEKQPLLKAADLVAELQQKDGSWRIDADGTLGSPVTYGRFLATYFARRTLLKADPDKHQAALVRSEEWLLKTKVENVMDAAAVLLSLDGNQSRAAEMQRQACLDLVRKGQAKDGGWGPYVTSPPEPFDTAVVLLALVRLNDDSFKPLIAKGRAYLQATQNKDGDWPATTRPAGAESYAQRLSTTAWATLALLATKGR